MKHSAFLLLCFLFIPFSSFAKAQINGNRWVLEVPSEDAFYVKTLKDFAVNADSSYSNFFGGLGLVRVKSQALKIKVFSDFDSYKKFQKRNSNSTSDSAFYSLFDSKVYTWEMDSSERILSHIAHEGTHHYIRQFTKKDDFSRCLDEGIAEMFEVGAFSSRRIDLSNKHEGWSQLLSSAYRDKSIKEFSFFLNMYPRAFVKFSHAKYPKLHIAQCWATAHFLYHAYGSEGRQILKSLILMKNPQQSSRETIMGTLSSASAYQDLTEKWIQFLERL